MDVNEFEVMYLLVELDHDLSEGILVTDKSGVSTVERLMWKMRLDPRQPHLKFGDIKETNDLYVQNELLWYLSQDLNVRNDYVGHVKIWQKVADADGFINSNYGWCVFSEENHRQYDHVVEELLLNPFSRRAEMIYNRPEMWEDYNKNGRSDFMCTDKVQVLIRNNKLIYHVHQRSCDLMFGFFNDFPWACYVYERLMVDLRKTYPDLEYGYIDYVCDSIHVYERHFETLKQMAKVPLVNP
jgi:thymidylate synthase